MIKVFNIKILLTLFYLSNFLNIFKLILHKKSQHFFIKRKYIVSLIYINFL